MTKKSLMELPPGIIVDDTKYPEHPDKALHDAGDYGSLTFYKTTAFGWCLATLKIASASRRNRNQTDRTYAVRVEDGQPVRVGAGPHVTQTITIYLRESRKEELKRYIEMFTSGMDRANTIRDRISSRRAQGAEERALGNHSWRWRV